MKSLKEQTILKIVKDMTFSQMVKKMETDAALEDSLRSFITNKEKALEIFNATLSKDRYDIYLSIFTRSDLENGSQWIEHFKAIVIGQSWQYGFKMPRLVFLPYNPDIHDPLESRGPDDVVVKVQTEKGYNFEDMKFLNPGVKLEPFGDITGEYCVFTDIAGLLPKHSFGTHVKIRLHTCMLKKEHSSLHLEEYGLNTNSFGRLMSSKNVPSDSYDGAIIWNELHTWGYQDLELSKVFFTAKGFLNSEDIENHEREILTGIIDAGRLFELKFRTDKATINPIAYSFDRWDSFGTHENGNSGKNLKTWEDCISRLKKEMLEELGEIMFYDNPGTSQGTGGSQRIIILLEDKKTFIGIDFECTRVYMP